MNWDYFIVDKKFKIRKFPVTKGTVKIRDITDINSYFRTEMKNYGKTIEESKKIFTEYYTEMVEVEVEPFDEYFDRNVKKFLGELYGLKGKYSFVQELFYWDDNEYWSEERSIETWDRLDTYNLEFSADSKTLIKMEKLGLIEIKSSSDKSNLIKYIESDTTVGELDTIAFENNLSITGKKNDKINQLIDALKKEQIKHTSIEMFRRGKNFQTWFNALQISYIDELEFAVSTFNYPEYYLLELWREAALVNGEFPLIEIKIKERQKIYFDIIEKNKQRQKDIVIPSTETFEIDGVNISITTTLETDKEEVEKKVTPQKNNKNYYYANKRKQKRIEVQKKQVKNKRNSSFLIIAIILIILFLLFT